MKDAMWKVDPSYGSPRPQEHPTADAESRMRTDTGPLRRILRDLISEAPDGRTIPELKRYALSWKPSTSPAR
jgi:hypothetical protein